MEIPKVEGASLTSRASAPQALADGERLDHSRGDRIG
jgi:hypothetical protein